MSLGFEPGITEFFARRQSYFKDINLEGSFAVTVAELRKKIQNYSGKKPSVVVLGAGPAGLMRAIQSIYNGNPTTVIEKRSEDASGRENTVALTEVTIAMMKYCGIYQYLIENKLIYPPNKGNYICVRLGDLEGAMKAVLKELDPKAVIYDTKVTDISDQSGKIELQLEKVDKQKSKISNIDILVNAEGSRSTTNELLNIRRFDVLPKIPVIAALYDDSRPDIRDLGTLIGYIARSLFDIAVTIYRHASFILKSAFSSHFRKQIIGALILQTPNQNYVGCGFSKEVNGKLRALFNDLNSKKELYKKTSKEDQKRQLEKEVYKAEKEYNSYAKYWVDNSICAANLFSLFKAPKHLYLYRAMHRKFKSFQQVEIGADRTDTFCKKMKNSFVLLAGDACATVDPTTGLGCNTAVQSSTTFLDFLWDYDSKTCSDQKLIHDYHKKMLERVVYIHAASTSARLAYSPEDTFINNHQMV